MNKEDGNLTCQNGSEELGAGEKVLEQIGVLNEATDNLEDHSETEGVEPEEVGRWITAIGRAVAAIFKL